MGQPVYEAEPLTGTAPGASGVELSGAVVVVVSGGSVGSGGNVTGSRAATTSVWSVLTVLVDSAERIVSAFSASAQVREVELRQLFDFSLSGANGAVLIDNAQIRLNRFVSYNESQATAKEAELDLLQRDMRSDVVQQVQRRLAAVKPASP